MIVLTVTTALLLYHYSLHHLKGGHTGGATVRSLLLRLVGLLVLIVLQCVPPATVIIRTYQHVLGTIGPVLYLSHGGVVVYRGGRTAGRCRVVRWGKP